jgi:hypothetical protein
MKYHANYENDYNEKHLYQTAKFTESKLTC